MMKVGVKKTMAVWKWMEEKRSEERMEERGWRNICGRRERRVKRKGSLEDSEDELRKDVL